MVLGMFALPGPLCDYDYWAEVVQVSRHIYVVFPRFCPLGFPWFVIRVNTVMANAHYRPPSDLNEVCMRLESQVFIFYL
jgi:hypothetical protein